VGADFPVYFPQFSVRPMKAEIHPEYKETVIQCTCGAIYQTRSTVQDLRIGICGACHPFFTGEQRFVDTAGRVDKFAQRYGSSQAKRRAEKPRRDVEPQKPRKKKEDEDAPEPEWENPAAEEAAAADDAVATPEADAAPAPATEEKADAAPATAKAAEAAPEADADAADSAES
jgi:large subunit ribosomal protein L31